MIKINELSKGIFETMVRRYEINKDTSIKAWLMMLSRLWREADTSLQEKECSRFIYSRLELKLADMMLMIVALLYRLGVRNIENLLRRRIEENDKEKKLKK